MPQIKIDYVVSFSSEDPEHPASSLVRGAVDGSGRWLCARGDPSASVLLQLSRATQISRVTIGAHHAALVEVLAGRSETPDAPMQVLVPSCVFVCARESRGGEAVQRVRSFEGDALAARGLFDRVRIVVSQPYNKHCQYGLSFVHLFEPESESTQAEARAGAEAEARAGADEGLKARLCPVGAGGSDSDSDEFRPGELFAQHRSQRNDGPDKTASTAATTTTNTDTGAEIRRASKLALKNVDVASTKLTKIKERNSSNNSLTQASSKTDDVQRHASPSPRRDNARTHRSPKRDDARRHATPKCDDVRRHATPKCDDAKRHASPRRDDARKHASNKGDDVRTLSSSEDGADATTSRDTNKRKRSEDEKPTDSTKGTKEARGEGGRSGRGGRGGGGGRILDGVVFVLSGYANPRRAQIRDQCTALGARYRPDWGPGCTHLVCAFAGTPKLRAVRSSAGGDRARVVTAEWVSQCAAEGRRVPWRRFATETHLRCDLPDSDDEQRTSRDASRTDDQRRDSDADADTDTDDEIERALAAKKRRKARDDISPRSGGEAAADDGDSEATVRDVTSPSRRDRGRGAGVLPELFAGRTFAVAAALASRRADLARSLRRYVTAYGGLIVDRETDADDDDDDEVDYVLCDDAAATQGEDDVTGQKHKRRRRGQRVHAHWVWRCHEAGAIVPI